MVFVRLPGGTIRLWGKWSRLRDGRTEATVQPFLMAKRPMTGEQWRRVMGKDLATFRTDSGGISYTVLMQFSRQVGCDLYAPRIEQRLYVLGGVTRWMMRAGVFP